MEAFASFCILAVLIFAIFLFSWAHMEESRLGERGVKESCFKVKTLFSRKKFMKDRASSKLKWFHPKL